MVIVGALTAFLVGPLGVWVGNWLGVGLAWLNSHAPFIFALLIPMIYPFLVPLDDHAQERHEHELHRIRDDLLEPVVDEREHGGRAPPPSSACRCS